MTLLGLLDQIEREADTCATSRPTETVVKRETVARIRALLKESVGFYLTHQPTVDWLEGMALAEDGTAITGHISSSVSWLKRDLGVTGQSYHHEEYREHYPDGYEVEWVEDPTTNEGCKAAIALDNARAEQSQAEGYAEGTA